MKLIGKLKKNADNAADKNEARDIIAKAGVLLTDDELNLVTGAGDGLWMVAGDPECDSCDGHPKMTRYYEEGNLITYICPLCLKTVTLFDQG